VGDSLVGVSLEGDDISPSLPTPLIRLDGDFTGELSPPIIIFLFDDDEDVVPPLLRFFFSIRDMALI
jgi:hypothetical protein